MTHASSKSELSRIFQKFVSGAIVRNVLPNFFFLLLVFIYKKCLIEIYFLLEKKVKIYFNSSELRKQLLYTIFITANHAPFY